MKKMNLLNKAEMKKVLGGNELPGGGGGMCSVSLSCDNGKNLSITDCIGTCSSGTDYVKCKGSTNTLTKWCDGTVDE